MAQILHQNSKGVVMVREDNKRRSQVKVYSGYPDHKYCLRTYRFDYVPDPLDVPYCSWANLDCCGGWSCDEEYLDTAVQRGLKLFAGRTTLLAPQYDSDGSARAEALRQFEEFMTELPAGIAAGMESKQPNQNYFYTYICRSGKITDYIDLETVFDFYKRLGQNVQDVEKKEVQRLCGYEMTLYGTDQAPFQYANAVTNAELITTGLLLGYPIESTVSILQGY